MGIKIGRIAGVIVLLGAAAAFGKFAANTGMFEKKPDAVYLTDNEEKNRIAYQSLDQKEKAVYSALYYGIAQKNELIPLPYEIDGDTYSKVYCLLEKQEGSFFYLGSSYYTAERIAKAQIVYRKNIEGADEKIEKLSQAEIDAVDEITSMSSMQTEYENTAPENDYRSLFYAQIGAEVDEIIIAGVSYTPVLCKGGGIRFVKTRYLVPLEEETTFEIGFTPSGKEALICKEGLFVVAIVEFVPISRSFVSALGGLYTYAQAELRKNKEKENENADTAD